ncbi:2OG-Fe(II) oxygenase [Helicobacter sp. NHP19-003]|uniref:2OG-Fe(II) oxygenase n=1 Tax=Helicobacter gastrocanis TaxID=2849641 RepID=A0ABM7SH90_9HELI|nr:2OG-Fe(II) oxygenase [Helicobacter sp. NHP19-003]BCZ17468.1 2OG-Fe(II) oxygenase [Helicobacter sp. NHP19-003]
MTSLDNLTLPVRLRANEPGILLIENFLSPEDCAELMNLSLPHLKPSMIYNSQTGSLEPSTTRTSHGTFFDWGANAVVSRIEAKITNHFGYHLEQQECIQIQRYRVNQEYKPHWDYYQPHLGSDNAESLRNKGQRIATFLFYLQPAKQGGGTVFPEMGLHFTPKAGSLIYFENIKQLPEDFELQPLSLHGGVPVLEGEKWIATKWIRQPKC